MASSVIWMSVIKQPLTAVEMRLWRQLDCKIWRDVCVLVNVAGRLGDWLLNVSGFKLDVKTEKWRRSWWMEFDSTNKMWCEIGYESVLLNVPEHTNSVDLSSTVSDHVRNSCRAVDWMTDFNCQLLCFYTSLPAADYILFKGLVCHKNRQAQITTKGTGRA
jgi:hypothetical protein